MRSGASFFPNTQPQKGMLGETDSCQIWHIHLNSNPRVDSQCTKKSTQVRIELAPMRKAQEDAPPSLKQKEEPLEVRGTLCQQT